MVSVRDEWITRIQVVITTTVVVYFLTRAWMPLGAGTHFLSTFFCDFIVGLVLGLLSLVVYFIPGYCDGALQINGSFSHYLF
ncbi:MAG: hypothetical protein R2744_08655 [Bacteroidales bacterium]